MYGALSYVNEKKYCIAFMECHVSFHLKQSEHKFWTLEIRFFFSINSVKERGAQIKYIYRDNTMTIYVGNSAQMKKFA